MARDGPGRRGRQRRDASALAQLPWRVPRNPYRPIEVLAEDQIEAIHDTSMQILEEIGMDFPHPEACDILDKAGTRVEPGAERVRFDRYVTFQLAEVAVPRELFRKILRLIDGLRPAPLPP